VKLLRETGSIKRRKGSARSTKRTLEVVDAVEEIMGKKKLHYNTRGAFKT
jgi:hypothetical protein